MENKYLNMSLEEVAVEILEQNDGELTYEEILEKVAQARGLL